jgi:uncharacterized membrane protein
MGLLFCLSLVPFGTGWMGETHFAPFPTSVYSGILLASALALWALQSAILATHGKDSLLGRAPSSDRKGKATLVILILAVGCAFLVPLVSAALCGLVDVIWVVPDRRIERELATVEGMAGE